MGRSSGIQPSEPQWFQQVEAAFNKPKQDRGAVPLHGIVAEFKKEIENGQIYDRDPAKVSRLMQKINILAEAKAQYYQASRFGFIKEIFSKFRNFANLGSYKNSAELAKEYTQEYTKGLNKAISERDKYLRYY